MREDETSSQGGDQSPSAQVAKGLQLIPEKVGCRRGDWVNDQSQTDQAEDEGVPSGERCNGLTWKYTWPVNLVDGQDRALRVRPTSLGSASSGSSASGLNGWLRQE